MKRSRLVSTFVLLVLMVSAAVASARGDDDAAAKERAAQAKADAARLKLEAVAALRLERLKALKIEIAPAPPATAPTPATKPEPPAGTKPPGIPAAPGAPGATPPTVPPTEIKPAPAPIDPLLVRCAMADGAIVIGKLATGAIEVDTKFGRLSVPIEKLVSIRPGLESRPVQRDKVKAWLAQLGSEDAGQRRAAATELAKIGLALRPTLSEAAKTAADPAKAELVALINRISEEAGEDGNDAMTATTLDIIRTAGFDMTGRVVPQTFTVATDLGTFTLPLAAIISLEREAVRNTDRRADLKVTGENFTSRAFLDAGLHLEKGDKVTIKASGAIDFNRLGSNARIVPDGLANYGWYISGKIASGALCYRIGGGELLRAGSSVTFTAATSGKLEFAVAMHERYLRGDQPATGEYKVQVKIERK